jgi:gluconolactonase
VANTPGEYVIAFDVQPDGTVTNQRDFGRLKGYRANEKGTMSSGSDGLAVDSTGRLYIVTNAGVEVFSPKGEHLGVIPHGIVPRGQNLAFAGPDKKELYVVGNGTVVKIPMIAQGFKGRAK